MINEILFQKMKFYRGAKTGPEKTKQLKKRMY